MMEIETKTPAFAEHIFLNALSRNNTPEEVLKQVLKCGYDHNALSSRFFSYDKGTRRLVPMHSLPHPFAVACENGNVPVMKLFLLLGVRPNAQIMEQNKTPLEVFDNPTVREVLEDDTPLLDMRFSKQLAAIMKGQLEANIMKKSFNMFIYGLQGLRITDTSFVFTHRFQNYTSLEQAFVYRMLMSPRQRKAIANKISKVCGCNNVPPALKRAIESNSDENVEKRKKCIASVGVLPLEVAIRMIDSLFSEEEQISLVRDIMDNYDAFRTNKALWSLKEELINPLFRHLYDIS